MSDEAGAVVTDASDFAPGSGLLRQSRFRLQAHAHPCTGLRKAAEGHESIRRVDPAVTCKAVIHRLVSERQNGANGSTGNDEQAFPMQQESEDRRVRNECVRKCITMCSAMK